MPPQESKLVFRLARVCFAVNSNQVEKPIVSFFDSSTMLVELSC